MKRFWNNLGWNEIGKKICDLQHCDKARKSVMRARGRHVEYKITSQWERRALRDIEYSFPRFGERSTRLQTSIGEMWKSVHTWRSDAPLCALIILTFYNIVKTILQLVSKSDIIMGYKMCALVSKTFDVNCYFASIRHNWMNKWNKGKPTRPGIVHFFM